MADEFEQQLKLEAAEKQRQAEGANAPDPFTYVDSDGAAYEWDSEKKAWFPKIDDNFIANYHANYGSSASEEPKPNVTDTDEASSALQGEKRKANSEPAWFDIDDEHNTKVYVSGLPLDITEDEYIELMSKCGMIMKDERGRLKIKLYKNSDEIPKGDGLCTYIKVESVGLALKILDGYRLRDNEIHVERAKFQMKGDYDPTKKPRKKKPKEKEKMKKKIEKLFDWRPEILRGMRLKHEHTAIIKNMFDPVDFEKEPQLILEYQKDLRDECSKCGEVKKVVIYDRNPEGIVAITFQEPEEADECVRRMNGRWFAQRQLKAETWDGRTKYKVHETEEQLEKRLEQWDKYLDEENDNKPNAENKTDQSRKLIPSEGHEELKGADLTDEERHSGEDSN